MVPSQPVRRPLTHPLPTPTVCALQDDFAALVRALETGKEATEQRPDGAAAREELYGAIPTAAIPALYPRFLGPTAAIPALHPRFLGPSFSFSYRQPSRSPRNPRPCTLYPMAQCALSDESHQLGAAPAASVASESKSLPNVFNILLNHAAKTHGWAVTRALHKWGLLLHLREY